MTPPATLEAAPVAGSTAPLPPVYNVGSIARFKGYHVPLAPGTPANFQSGDLVEIFAPAAGADGKRIPNGWFARKVEAPAVSDTIFSHTELDPVSAEEVTAARLVLNQNLGASTPEVVQEQRPAAPEAPSVPAAAAPPVPAASVPPVAEYTAPAAPAPVAAPAKRGRKATAPATPAPVAETVPAAPAPAAAPAKRGRKPAAAAQETTPPASGPVGVPTSAVQTRSAAPTLTDSTAILSLCATPQAALKSAKDMLATKAYTDHALGGVLSYIKRHNIHHTLVDSAGQPRFPKTLAGFNAYVAQELGMGDGDRSIHMKIVNYEAIAALGLPAELEQELAGLGVNRVNNLARILTDASKVPAILEAVRGKTSDEVKEYVRQQQVALDGGTSLRPHTHRSIFHFSLADDQGATCRQALEIASKQVTTEPGGTVSESQAFHLIMSDYLERQNPAPVPLESAIQQLEALYGVTVQTTPAGAVEQTVPATA